LGVGWRRGVLGGADQALLLLTVAAAAEAAVVEMVGMVVARLLCQSGRSASPVRGLNSVHMI